MSLIPMPDKQTLYTPALVIVAVVMLLLIFIGFSTYWNLDRARSHALDLSLREGTVIFQAIEAGAGSVTGRSVNPVAAVERLIGDIADHPDIAYIYISDKNGRVVNSSNGFSPDSQRVWHPIVKPGDTVSRFLEGKNNIPVFELAGVLRFSDMMKPTGAGFRRLGRIRRGLSPYRDAFMVIGLKMTGFSAARHEDMQHAFIMVSILIILGGGTIFFIYVIHRYQRMNRALKEARDYTGLVVDSMANGLLSIDPDGRILSFNRHGLDLLGISEADAGDFKLATVLDFDACGISETLANCSPVFDREITFPGENGRRMRVLSLSVTPIPENGWCGGAVVMLRDLTEIKGLEEKVKRAEKLAALGKLAAAVAHEIRNPLSSIRGFARFLSRQLEERPEDREYADIMVREVDRINRVVTDLLNFARPLELTPSPVNPAELLAHPLSLVKGDAASRGISIHEHVSVNISGDAKPVLLDSSLLTHALLNLLLNALFAAGTGGRIDAGVFVEQGRFADKDRPVVKFVVEDDGPGIPREYMEKIFDPFFTTRENGTGLGLAIVHKFVEMHHGTIRVESPVPEKETGCRFTVELPAEFAST